MIRNNEGFSAKKAYIYIYCFLGRYSFFAGSSYTVFFGRLTGFDMKSIVPKLFLWICALFFFVFWRPFVERKTKETCCFAKLLSQLMISD